MSRLAGAPLLSARCRVPPRRPGAVSRARLEDALDRAAALPVAIVCAPPGYGKSTLLGEWSARPGSAVAWVSLDAGDGDVHRLLDCLVVALQRAVPGRAEAAAQLLRTVPPTAAERILAALVDDLSESGAPLTIVLDDYHLVDSRDVHQAVAFLGEHLPAGICLVLATRAEPALPLARWRAEGRLTEIRAADLAFTPDEAGRFLRGTMGLALGDEAVSALTERTEGWAAGLQMAALALRRHEDPEGFIEQFTGSHRFVLDYLIEEVLSGQPAAVRGFLLRTSILERLCGPLCEAVTGEAGGADTLRALSRQALFLEALNDQGAWYRYHRLFADLLRYLLRREHPGIEAELHRRACAWHREAGLTRTAVGHALASGDGEMAVGLVESAAEAVLSDGEFASLAAWVEALPASALRARPALRALQATALFYAGRPTDQVEQALAEAEAPRAGPEARGSAAALRAVMAALRGEADSARGHAARALRLLPRSRPFLRAMAGTTLGLAALQDGDPAAAERAFRETLRAVEPGGNLVLRVLATRRLAGAAAMRGDLHEAEARYREILSFTPGDRVRRHPLSGLALLGLGQVLRERNELAEAEACTREGLELCRRLGPPFALDGLVGLSRILMARGDLRGAASALAEAARLAELFDVTDTDDAYVAALAARLHLEEGDLAGAARWAEEQGVSRAGPPGAAFRFYPEEAEQATLARLLLRSGRHEQARAVIEPLLARAEAQARLGSVIELEVLRSLALEGTGASRPALAALARALTLAAAHGQRRAFLDEGEPLAALLRRAVTAGVAPPYGKAVLAAFAVGAAGRTSVPGLSEPLTPRERRVLRHLTGSLTVPEIARELYVAPSTVRSHLKSIYRKLGVGRRGAAVERARDLGLL